MNISKLMPTIKMLILLHDSYHIVMKYIDPEEFLFLSENIPVIDARAPLEFSQGHIPGAINLPLFDDDERKRVGTLYKQSGRQSAILAGLDFVGPKMSKFVKDAQRIALGKKVLLHCWRGGMRSAGMGWLLKTADFDVSILEGGYKSYRRYIRQKLGKEIPLVILGGKTGSGKSEVLEAMEKKGEQTIDLEKIAHHKGSAFGDLGQEEQPTNEQFENNLFDSMKELDLSKSIWVEDESRGIGFVSTPDPFYQQMRNAKVIFIDIPKSFRIKRLVKEYASFDPQRLENAIIRITKKLGGQNSKLAIEALKQKDYDTAADILLVYYDKAYLKGLSFRDQNKVYEMPVDSGDPENIADQVLKLYLRHKIESNQTTKYESHLS